MKLYYQNIHSIRGRLNVVRNNIGLLDEYDIIALTETWLNENINDAELGLYNYNIVRCDRSLFTSDKNDGGGVLIALHRKFKFEKIIISNNIFELLFVKVFTDNTSFIVGVCYIPTGSKSEYYSEFIECIQTSLRDILANENIAKFSLLGDFNIPGYQWLNESRYSTALGYHKDVNFREAAYTMSEWCKSYNVIQLNSIKNASGNILDLVFTNFYSSEISLCNDYLIKCDEAHHPLSVSFLVSAITYCDFNDIILDFKHANFAELSEKLSEIVIPAEISGELQFNECVSDVERVFQKLIGEYVPTLKIKSRNFPHWYSNELKAAIINKKISHKLYKTSKSKFFFDKFKKDRAYSKLLACRDEKLYLESTEESIRDNSKNFFKYVNNLSSNNSIPSTLHLSDQTADNAQDIVNLFAKKFSSIYRNIDLSNTAVPYVIDDSIGSIVFTTEDIESCINNLKSSQSPGPDNIHPIIVINCSDAIKHWLLQLFNLSVKIGIFPQTWKLSYISPFFKGGDQSDVNNYRPINKYKVFAKMMDFLIYTKLLPYFRKYIVPQQHGFLESRSTVTNLSVYTEYITSQMNNSNVVDSVYIDFTRAFDLVNFSLLLKKLRAYGVFGDLFLWFESFLNGRQQMVKIKNFTSTLIEVLSGVGQGTHLGPLLFLIFINDITQSIKYCEISLFADDTKIYRAIESSLDAMNLQLDINSFEGWCNLNGLQCNIKKCFTIRFGKSRQPIYDYFLEGNLLERVDHIRDLGVILDSKLSFKFHIDYLDINVRKNIYFVKRFSFKFKSIHTFRSIYFAYIYSKLMYASTIWRPYEKGDIKRLESLNTLFLRYAAFKTGYALHFTDHDFSSTYRLFHISTLESARDRADIIFAFKIHNQLIDCSDILGQFVTYCPPRILRHNNYYFSIPILKMGQRKSIVCRLSELCNDNADWFDLYDSSLNFVKNQSMKLLKYD